MFGRTIDTWPMSFHTTSKTIIFMGLGKYILYILSIFLFHLGLIPLLVVQ